MSAAEQLAHEAMQARSEGRVVAAEILERAADFASRRWPHAERYVPPPWQPKATEPTPATGIERGTPRGDE